MFDWLLKDLYSVTMPTLPTSSKTLKTDLIKPKTNTSTGGGGTRAYGGSGGGTRGETYIPTNIKTPVKQSAPTTTNYKAAAAPVMNKIDWQNKSTDEMANILGMTNYKYEDILKNYESATNKKFDEYDTQMKRNRADNLRTLEGQYETYLNTLRENRANAVSNGINKGTSAAMQLASMFGNAQTIKDNQQVYNDKLYDLVQERGTALEQAKINAKADENALLQYLGTLRGTYEANSVNELASRLGYAAQVKAADIAANATKYAANTSSSASQYAETLKLYQAAYGQEEGLKKLVSDMGSSADYTKWLMANNKTQN